MRITKVEAKPKEKKRLRVAAYARVSADKDAAFHSLEQQEDYYGDYVTMRPDWELVAIYSDNAISGTKVDRPEFQRMLTDCRAGKIDLIVTKSITRFARNTLALLETVQELKRLGIDVYFEKENMHSMSPDGELLLTFLAMYAEEETRSASENQKWRIKKKFEQGQTTLGRMLGYRLKDGKLVIVPEEAEIVQQIFRDFLSGKSLKSISRELDRSNISARFSDVWNRTTILYILTNEKYTGNMLLQKTYCPDFRTKKRSLNRGEVQKYQVTSSHEAIISEADFAKAQELLEKNRKTRRAELANTPEATPPLFVGLVECGLCGSAFCRKNNGSGKYRHKIWTCLKYAEHGKAVCPAQAIPERILIEQTQQLLGEEVLTRKLLTEHISIILVPGPNRLVYHFHDGRTEEITWQHHSRRESWTPEMREKARERTLKRYRKEEV